MLVAVLFLLLGVWSAELALFDIPYAPLAGAGCLAVCASILTGLAIRESVFAPLSWTSREHTNPPILPRNQPRTPQEIGGSTPFSQRSATFVQ